MASGRRERVQSTPSAEPVPNADPLVVRRLEFLGGMVAKGGWRPQSQLPEVAFAGRSNVGKSSLLNTLVRRRRFARVSNTPGRTREINFFRVNDRFVLVDLPGYGFAQISKQRRAVWKPLIEEYLRTSPELRGIVMLVDARHEPSRDDEQMLTFLAALGAPTLFALTKIDKLSRSRREARIAELTRDLGAQPEQVIPFSAVTGEGRNELAEAVVALIDQPSWQRMPPPRDTA
jgi:GTP-binding protein